MWTELIKNFGDIFLKPKTCTVICWNCCWKLLQLFWITRDLRCQKHLGILGFLQRQSKSEDMALSSGPLRKQKVTSTGSKGHGLWFVIGRFRSVLCVCCFWISEFLKSAVSFPALCLVDQGDLYFDVLLCDVNFSCFSSRVFLPSYWSLDSQGEIVPLEETQWKQVGTFPPTFDFAASARYFTVIWQTRIGCYGSSLIDMEKKPKILKHFWQRWSHVIQNIV